MSLETVKKTKISIETVSRDMATSIESLAKSIETINTHHRKLLQVNKAVVALQLKLDKEKKELETSVQIQQGK